MLIRIRSFCFVLFLFFVYSCCGSSIRPRRLRDTHNEVADSQPELPEENVEAVEAVETVDEKVEESQEVGTQEEEHTEHLVPKHLDAQQHNHSDAPASEHAHSEEHHEPHGVKVASFKFDYVKAPLVLTMFIVAVGLLKIGYHHAENLQKLIPESCLLIILGILIGFFFMYDETNEAVQFLKFDSKTFFLYLLPPIILESAFSLRDRAFIDNLGTIVLYAVVGTVLNIIIIGAFLIGLSYFGILADLNVEPLDCLLFASLIAAVDPVAVLAIFQEVGVNQMLYFMVFGESLLNDAVTVVVYNLVNEFKELPAITFNDCFIGLLAFLCVALGALGIGIVCGIISSVITKHTEHIRVIEPVIVFGMAYLSYVSAELFHFSGIIAIIGCGLFQAHYTCNNISPKTYMSVTYFAKVLSGVSESLIFIILGVMLVQQNWFWSACHPLFSVFALLICIVARVVVVYFLTYIVNSFTGGVRYISFNEQLIMAYGGLRGAVSFSLAFMMDDAVPTKSALLAATYVVILFTVFIQGCTIKSLVQYLDIRLAKREDNYRLFIEFNKGMINYMSQGLEDLLGYEGTFSWITFAHSVSKRYIRPLLHKNYHEEVASSPHDKLVQLEREMSLRENLQQAPKTRSFKRQQTIDEMTEQGELPHDLLEEEPFLPNTRKAEKEVDDLTRDISDIRNLVKNPLNDFYIDRNLKEEDKKVERQKTALDHLQRIHLHALSNDMSVTTTKRNLFGKRKEKKKMCVQKGMLALGVGAIGFNSQEVVNESIPEGIEVSYSSQISRERSDSDESTESSSRKRIVSEGDNLRYQNQDAKNVFETASESDLQKKTDL